MTSFQKQLEAIGSALLLIKRLPEGSVWSLCATNDDDAESPTVLNVFADEEHWGGITSALGLGRALDRGRAGQSGRLEKFVSFRQGTLMISLIEEVL